MTIFSTLDLVAVAFFLLAWFGYHLSVERARSSLNILMNQHRHGWMRQVILRDNRVVDTTIMASLQNGTAFFASTSLIAVGGVLTLLRASDEVLLLLSEIPFAMGTSRLAWEAKVVGLAVIFVYAFFKFAWTYRIFNYVAILIGAIPVVKGTLPAGVEAAAERAARMNVVAGRHFNRGQRAFFFALAYLGWFLGPLAFIAATGAVLYVMWRRQFASDAIAALGEAPGEGPQP